jgi:hypothetical protein
MMKNYTLISSLYYASAAYDGLLGLAFLSLPLKVFSWFGTTPPNHVGYVHFPAALLIVFAVMFVNIARNPLRYRILIPYGLLLKLSYCTVVFWHWFSAGIPAMWKPFAVIDVLFAVLFAWTSLVLGQEAIVHGEGNR